MTKTRTLTRETPAIQRLCRRDKHFAKAVELIGPVTYRYDWPAYPFLMRQIMGQMLSNKVMAVFYRRLVDLCAGQVTPAAVAALPDEALRAIGLSRSKVTYIRSLTAAVTTGRLDFALYPPLTDRDIIQDLTAVRGIGQWTAKMYLIFVLDREDVLPVEDVAFQQGFEWLYHTRDPELIEKKTRKWRPYRSLAAHFMYDALDRGLTKSPCHLFKA